MNFLQIFFFLVPEKTGDLRPVINLKPLNQFVQKNHFKMENIQMPMNSVSLGDYIVSLDLLKGRLFQCANFSTTLQINIWILFGETRDMTLLVYVLVIVWHLGFLPRFSNLVLHNSE